MDKRLLEACQTGNTLLLHHLLADDPMILHRTALSSPENPLHVASLAGHAGFAREILRLKPDFAWQANHEGFSPMHMASANGYPEVARELMRVDRRLSRAEEGRNRWTPLHFAASRGRSEVIGEILSACPESIGDVTAQRETALHVAVKSGQSEAVEVMLRWVRAAEKEEVLNLRDELGNSVLHVATWKKNRQVVEWLLGNNNATLQVNAVNESGLTPLDALLIFPSEAGDREIEDLLRRAGATRAKDVAIAAAAPPSCLRQPRGVRDDLVEYFKFKKGRDTPSDVRTALLVMAVLVATATFQVGINPPSGIWQDSGNRTATTKEHLAGRSILGSYSSATYLVFVIFNSTGLSVSLYMITVLTSDFPMRLEFEMCIIALYVTYYIGLGFMAPDGLKLFVTVFSAIVPPLMVYLIKLLKQLLRALRWVLSLLFHFARYVLFRH